MIRKYLYNIIIPSIEIDNYLENCLIKLEDQTYKNFFVTIVLDKKDSLKKKYKFKIVKLISGKINMSKKRNIGARVKKSDYIAFLDSDAYPNKNWLKNANHLFNKKENEILGGPNIPFPNETESEILSHYCKRSFFVNGHLAYRKYLSKDAYINDWLESCNFFVKTKIFLEVKGMNEKIYIGEDQDFFKKLKQMTNIKIYFSRKLFVYHKDRNIKNFLLQRFCFGLDVFNGLNIRAGLKGVLVLLPFVTLSFLIIFSFLPFSIEFKFSFFSVFCILFILFVFLEIKNYVKKNLHLHVIFFIILSNLIYGFAGFCSFFGLRKPLEKIIYRLSR